MYWTVETSRHGGEKNWEDIGVHEEICRRGSPGAAHCGKMFRWHDKCCRVHWAQGCEYLSYLFIHLVNYFLVVTMLIGNKSYNLEKPVYFPLNGATIVRKMHLWVECQRMWLMKNLPDLLDDWSLKKPYLVFILRCSCILYQKISYGIPYMPCLLASWTPIIICWIVSVAPLHSLHPLSFQLYMYTIYLLTRSWLTHHCMGVITQSASLSLTTHTIPIMLSLKQQVVEVLEDLLKGENTSPHQTKWEDLVVKEKSCTSWFN